MSYSVSELVEMGEAPFERIVEPTGEGDGVDTADLLELLHEVDFYASVLGGLKRDLMDHLATIVDEPRAIGTTIYGPTVRRRWGRPTKEVVNEVLSHLARVVVDPESGESIRVVEVDDLRDTFTVSGTPTVRLIKRFGLEVEEYPALKVTKG